MNEVLVETLKVCHRHADRLLWALSELERHLPFTGSKLTQLSNVDLAILDQFTTRFGKLQDLMGAKLFPAVLELTKESVELKAFIDKLNHLEKLGAIPSADQWLLMREIRNAFSHDYPDDPDLQAAVLNQAVELARQLTEVLTGLVDYIQPYLCLEVSKQS
jgi:hypothetical protein